MIFPLIIGIILGVISVVFALQNVAVVTLTFFSLQFEGSLALILLLAIVMGILVSLLIVLPESVKNYFRYKRLKKANQRLEEELKKQKELNVFAKNTPATPEEIEKIDQGSIANPSSNIVHPSNNSG